MYHTAYALMLPKQLLNNSKTETIDPFGYKVMSRCFICHVSCDMEEHPKVYGVLGTSSKFPLTQYTVPMTEMGSDTWFDNEAIKKAHTRDWVAISLDPDINETMLNRERIVHPKNYNHTNFLTLKEMNEEHLIENIFHLCCYDELHGREGVMVRLFQLLKKYVSAEFGNAVQGQFIGMLEVLLNKLPKFKYLKVPNVNKFAELKASEVAIIMREISIILPLIDPQKVSQISDNSNFIKYDEVKKKAIIERFQKVATTFVAFSTFDQMITRLSHTDNSLKLMTDRRKEFQKNLLEAFPANRSNQFSRDSKQEKIKSKARTESVFSHKKYFPQPEN